MHQKKLLIATRNKGKFPEIVLALKVVPFELLNLNDILALPPGYEVEEPAMTFEGNALIKAMTLGRKTGLMVLADDSGLEVDALGGAPGVLSARYAPGSDADRRRKLLRALKNVPDTGRGAQFRCCIAIFDPETEKVRTCEAVYRGSILREERGKNGFGFDPIFYNDTLGKTNAEMDMDEKNAVSHRGKALKRAAEILLEEFRPLE